MKKKLLSLVAIIPILIIIGIVNVNANAKTVDRGSCGDNVVWVLDDEGTLTITGEGSIQYYVRLPFVPWTGYYEDIYSIVISDGVTGDGGYAFSEIRNLKYLEIGNGYSSIDDWMLLSAENLTDIKLCNSITNIKTGVFSKCKKLKNVYFNGSEEEWKRIKIDEGNDPILSATIHFTDKKQGVSESSPILVELNGQPINFDQPPIIIDGRTLVPLRAIFEALGATVDWDGNTQTVTATRDNKVIKITIGDNKLYVNNNVTVLDVPAQIINDRTLVPVRAVSEAFGCNVDWDGETRTVHITSNKYPTSESVSSKWLGKWVADSGESLDIYSVSELGLNVKFNHYLEDGSYISSDIEMVFDNPEKTIASEIDGSHLYGWEYTLVLNDEAITMQTRYPDQVYYRE